MVKGFSGIIPLTYGDLKSWSEMTVRSVNPWEAQLLIKLSRQYCGQTNISKEKGIEAPYKAKVTNNDMVRVREKADDKIRNLF